MDNFFGSQNVEQKAFDAIQLLTATPDDADNSDNGLIHLATLPGFIDLTQEPEVEPTASICDPPMRSENTSNDEDDELIHLVTQPGFIDLTQEPAQEPHPTTSKSPKRSDNTPNSSPVHSYQDQIISSTGVIDVGAEVEALAGPSNIIPPKKRRYNIEVESSSTLTAPDRELNHDNSVLRTDDITSWTKSQVDAWDRSSWGSEQDDDGDASVRGRQTPYPFHETSEEEEEEEEEGDNEEEERILVRQNDDPYVARIDAHFATIHNRLAVIESQCVGVHNRLVDADNRIDALFAGVHNRLDVFHNSVDAQFATIHYRLDGHDSMLREIIPILCQRCQTIENGIRRFESSAEENYARIHRDLSDQLRERQLIVSLLGAITNCLHPR